MNAIHATRSTRFLAATIKHALNYINCRLNIPAFENSAGGFGYAVAAAAIAPSVLAIASTRPRSVGAGVSGEERGRIIVVQGRGRDAKYLPRGIAAMSSIATTPNAAPVCASNCKKA